MPLDDGPQNRPPHCGKYINIIGRVQHIIITPIRVMPVSVLNLDPLKKITCVKTAPTFPPPPIKPDITPSDLMQDVTSTSS